MTAVLIVIAILALCVYAMINPADVVGGLRIITVAAREQPEGAVVSAALLVAVITMFWVIVKVAMPSRPVVYVPGMVTASLQRRLGHATDQELERAARHEAAHTLAAYLLGATRLTADVHVVDDRNGRATHQHTGDATVWDDAYDDLVIGFAAQVIDHQTGHFDAGSMTDMASQQRRLMVILSAGKQPLRHSGPLTVEALIESTRTEAENLLAEHAGELERLTAALVEKSELEDDEIRALIRPPVTP